MRLDIIKLTNFKNFKQLDFIISNQHNVHLFVGSNGSGKTSILEAINVAMGGFFASQEQKMQRVINFEEIRMKEGLRAELASVEAKSSLIKSSWSRTINRKTKKNDSMHVRSASNYGEDFFKSFEKQDDKTAAPLLAYYSTQRLFKDSSKTQKQLYDPSNGRSIGYLNCLNEKSIKGVLDEWMGNAVTRRATLKIKEIDNVVNLVLENVESAIRITLIDFLELPEHFPLKIYQDPDFDNELFVSYDSEHNLPISYYSDGFRNLLYLVIDLVWRASQLNPWLALPELSKTITGIITLDEIDLHLHPKWQAKAIPLLQKLFPEVQFFITTHSPTVVANFDKGILHIINEGTIETYQDKYFGRQINSTLRNVLGANDRHVPTQKKLDTLLRLIDERKSDEYEPLLIELTSLLSDQDSDIIFAKTLIDLMD